MTAAASEKTLLARASPRREVRRRALRLRPTAEVKDWLAESALETDAADCLVIPQSPEKASAVPSKP
jgi:hypothetical protein